MKRVLTAALLAASLAAFGAQAGADELRVPASLVSFGAGQTAVMHINSAAGLVLGPAETFSNNNFVASATVLPVRFGGLTLPQSYAASTALSVHMALDSGYNLDLTQRFDNYGATLSPLLDQGNYLALANGGHYGGLTFALTPDLRLRLGAQVRSNQNDGLGFDPAPALTGLPAPYDNGQQRSLLAGASWDVTNWAGINLSGIVSSQKGQPAGFNAAANLTPASTASTSALAVSAHVNLGGGWVTTASFSGGLTELDQKSGDPSAIDSHTYSIALAKQGLFGQDAVGVSVSRPTANLLNNNFDAMTGDLPPVAVTGRLPGSAPETDLQLGYVTSFLNGALALQANAAYEMNYQGQTGATSLAVLSRAKIKF